jgi:ATPase subunit of ABC transporter with duplicated ATPase domains
MGHIDVQHVSYSLPDGRPLLSDVSFRVPDGATAALVGANGAGKTTLLRMIAGDLDPHEGSIVRSGTTAVMRQFIGQMSEGTVRDLLLDVSPESLTRAAGELDAAELAMMEADDEATQMRYAHAIADYAEAGGYEAEVLFDVVTTAAMGETFDAIKWRPVSTLSGGEQKRLVLELLLRGPADILLLDEPDNYLDVPGKAWLEQRLRETPKTILLISHDRELLNQSASHIVSVELGAAGNTVWVHGGGFASFHEARADRFSRLEELRRRWDEEHVKLKELVQSLKVKAAYNDGMASRYQAAQTRLRKFEEVGPPIAVPREQKVRMRLTGGRTAKRAIVCEGLDPPVRRRGVVRGAAGRAWGQRIGQESPAQAAGPRWHRSGLGAPAGGRHRDRAGSSYRNGSLGCASAARLVCADACAPGPLGPHLARDPAPR